MAPSTSRPELVVLLLASLSLQLLIPSTVAAAAVEEGSAHRPRQRRRRLAPHENLHRYLQSENDAGNMRPRVTLVAMKADVDNDNNDVDVDVDANSKEYDIDVVQVANQAVTRKTTYSIDGGERRPIGDLGVKFLVQDRSPFGEDDDEEEGARMAYKSENGEPMSPTTTAATTFALISVDEDTEIFHGIAKKRGDRAVNVRQSRGSTMVASPAGEFVPPKDFTCQVTRDQEDRGRRREGKQRNLLGGGGGERSRVRYARKEEGGSMTEEHIDEHDHGGNHDDRNLHRHNHNHDHDHNHNHNHNHDDDHGHDHDHDHDHDHLFSEDDIDNLINPKTRPKHRRTTGGFSSVPSHQVDLYIEIDQDFVNKNQANLTIAFRYVNTLVTAASTIYEAEVDTRLTVAHVDVTNRYENATSSREALDDMREHFGNSSAWHFEGADLHHAILGRRLNGGIAFVGSVCSPDYGFGVSPNMRGSFLSLDFATVWDTSVLAHEIGHNFGALHTHDRRVASGGFKPPVDRCFIRTNDLSSCPTEAQLEGSATLMSYCDACPGASAASLAYTFGGDFVGDDPSDIDGWRNNPSLVGGFNREPKRVPKAMYDHVSSATCTQPDFQCEADSDCFDWRRCTVDTCNADQCEHKMRENCCGNGICEPNELPCNRGLCVPNRRTCVADCGPINLETKRCDNCNAKRGKGNGVMIDMRATSSARVIVNSIRFRHTQTTASTITIYTADGSYMDRATSPEEWDESTVAEVKIEGRKGGYATVDLAFPIAIAADSVRSFYIASTGKLISGNHEEGAEEEPLASDGALSVLYPARIVGYPFGGGVKGSWDGELNYSLFPLISN